MIATDNGLNKNLHDISKYFFYFIIICKFLSKYMISESESESKTLK